MLGAYPYTGLSVRSSPPGEAENLSQRVLMARDLLLMAHHISRHQAAVLKRMRGIVVFLACVPHMGTQTLSPTNIETC